jgi:tetratricopeptide (TPR) repeat protein
VQPATLQSIFDVFLKTRERHGAAGAASTSASSSTPAAAPSADDKAAAEKLKAEGNAHMSAKRYALAVGSYTDAIGRDPTSAVFFSNRAAAHISLGDHASAIADAERALELDPKFVRAYSRLGCVHILLRCILCTDLVSVVHTTAPAITKRQQKRIAAVSVLTRTTHRSRLIFKARRRASPPPPRPTMRWPARARPAAEAGSPT